MTQTKALIIRDKSSHIVTKQKDLDASTIILEHGITDIGEAAFWYKENLTTVLMPTSIRAIRDKAFYNCCLRVPNSRHL